VCKLTLDTTRPCFCSSPPLPRKKEEKNNERNESCHKSGEREGEKRRRENKWEYRTKIQKRHGVNCEVSLPI